MRTGWVDPTNIRVPRLKSWMVHTDGRASAPSESVQEPQYPDNEVFRVEVLHTLDVLDRPADPDVDRLVALTARITGFPIVLVSLVDHARQWFWSRHGLAAAETERRISFCGHAILGTEPLEVPDAMLDPRFHDNPLVTGPPHVRSYFGVPLITEEGTALGTLCAIDTEPRRLDPLDREVLVEHAKSVVRSLELKRSREWLRYLTAENEQLQSVLEQARGARVNPDDPDRGPAA